LIRLVRRHARLAFWLYVPALFLLTHWPGAQVPMRGRPDLVVHTVIFGLWTALAIAAGFFGSPLSFRNIGLCGLIGAAYSAIDEALQAIPFVRRHAAWDDWLANLTGVAAAAVGAIVLRLALDAFGSARARDAQPADGRDASA